MERTWGGFTVIEVYPICAKCEDGGDLTAVFHDDNWYWHCDSCGTERILTENEIDILLGFGGGE